MKIYAKTVGEFIDEVENRTFLAALEKNYRVLVGKVQAGEYRALARIPCRSICTRLLRRRDFQQTPGSLLNLRFPGCPSG